MGTALIINNLNPTRMVWVEDESRMVGRCCVPKPFWDGLRRAHVLIVERPISYRIQQLEQEYGKATGESLISCTTKLKKRLGSDRMQRAIDAIRNNTLPEAIAEVLHYYDKTYQHGLRKRKATHLHPLSIGTLNATQSAQKIQMWLRENQEICL